MSEKLKNDLWKNQFLTQKEVANLLRVSEGTVRNYRKRGLLSFFQPPGSTRVLYLAIEVQDFTNRHITPKKGGDSPKKPDGNLKGKPVVSKNSDQDWRI